MRNVIASLSTLCFVTSFGAVHAQTASGEGPETLPPKIFSNKEAAKRDLRGVRVAKPGALVFASFDTDSSLVLTDTEISEGSVRAFKTADKNGDGKMSIFEQQAWAAAVGAHDGPLANSMTFDANLDRQVSPTEFTEGLMRISRAYIDPGNGELPLSNLLEAPAGANHQPREETIEEIKPMGQADNRSGVVLTRR